MIHREAWYRELQAYLGEQETQSLEEDIWAHPRAPGKYPPFEEVHPYSDEKESGKEPFETGGGESLPGLNDLMKIDPGAVQKLWEVGRANPEILWQMASDPEPSEVFGLTVSPKVAWIIYQYVTSPAGRGMK